MTYEKYEKYFVRIVVRDFQGQIADDYHATVTRKADGVELIWISRWRWFLKWQLKPKKIDRAFKRYDKHQDKLARTEEWML